MGSITLKFEVPDSELKALKRRLASLGVTTPVMVEAIERFADDELLPALRAAAPRPSIGSKIVRGKVRGGKTGVDVTVRVAIRHRAARAFEFGRRWWYYNYRRRRGRRAILSQNPPKRRGPRGFPAQPWIGVKGGGVLARMRPRFAEVIEEAAERIWADVGKA